MATLFTVDGNTKEVTPNNGKDFSLQELQGFVGGYVELVPVFKDQYIAVDEEGRMKGYKHNANASLLVKGQVHGDIVGDMLLCKRKEIK